MSASNLNAFLIKLHNELSGDSDVYRKHVTNKKLHVFTYKSTDIRKAIKVVLQEAIGKDEAVYSNQNFKKPFDKAVKALTKKIKTNFEKAHNPNEGIIVKNIRGGVSATFA